MRISMGSVCVCVCVDAWAVCVWLLILWVSMMCSDRPFQNNVAEQAQAIFNFTHNHISHTQVLENTHTHTHTQIWISSYCACSYAWQWCWPCITHTHWYRRTHTHSLPSNGTRDASIVRPTFSRSRSLSLIHVFHRDRCQRLVNQAADWWLERAEWTHGLVPIWGHVEVCLSVGRADFSNCNSGEKFSFCSEATVHTV